MIEENYIIVLSNIYDLQKKLIKDKLKFFCKFAKYSIIDQDFSESPNFIQTWLIECRKQI